METREEFLTSYGKTEEDVRKDVTGEYIVITAAGTHEKIYLPTLEDYLDDDEAELPSLDEEIE